MSDKVDGQLAEIALKDEKETDKNKDKDKENEMFYSSDSEDDDLDDRDDHHNEQVEACVTQIRQLIHTLKLDTEDGDGVSQASQDSQDSQNSQVSHDSTLLDEDGIDIPDDDYDSGSGPIVPDFNPNHNAEESSADYRVGGYHPVAIGDVFKDRYYAIHKLGWGHFSTVWLCYDIRKEDYCAVKVVKSAEHFTDTARDEIRLLGSVSEADWHPLRHRLVEFRDHFYVSGLHGTHLCLVFEVLGDNLLTLIQRSRYQGLPLNNVKQIALQVLEGLCFLHTECHIIHTDLKPENVLLVADDLTIRGHAHRAAVNFLKAHSNHHKSTGHGGGPTAPLRSQVEEVNDDDDRCDHVRKQNLSPAPGDAKLTKTAKRRLRARAKRSINFFQQHRQWLRQRAIEDLLGLAARGLLSPTTAVQAVTGKLPFMPFTFDGLVILSDSDLLRLEQVALIERVGDMPASSSSRGGSPTNMKRNPVPKPQLSRSSTALRLLLNSPEKFMRYVQKKATEADLAGRMSLKLMRKQRGGGGAGRKPRPLSARKRGGGGTTSGGAAPAGGSIRVKMEDPDPNILSRKDPATQTCRLNVKIADMGNGCWFHHHFTDDIQTREYRAVEVILGAGYDETADVWSAACLFWELATGDYLFDPQLERGQASLDEAHIANIIETCGPIPKELLEQGEYSEDIFLPDGQMRNVEHLQTRSLANVLVNQYRWPRKDAVDFVAFLEPMLRTDPRLRSSALDAMLHKWLRHDTDLDQEDRKMQRDKNRKRERDQEREQKRNRRRIREQEKKNRMAAGEEDVGAAGGEGRAGGERRAGGLGAAGGAGKAGGAREGRAATPRESPSDPGLGPSKRRK